jgi:hypothetical protein
MSDEIIIAPGSVIELWAPKFSTGGGVPGVTRTSEDGLNARHVQEVLMIADRLGTGDVDLITATQLRAHGNAGSAEAVEKWRPHVERALRQSR